MTWITTQQAADKLGVSRAWIIRLIHAGRIVAEKFGRDWKVNPYSLKNYEATKRSPGRPPGTDKAAILADFVAGRSVGEIAKKRGISKSYAHKIRKEAECTSL